jgi:hypothetical protein
MSLTVSFKNKVVGLNQESKLSRQTVFGSYKASWTPQRLTPSSFVLCIHFFSYGKIKTIASGYHSTYY